MSNSNEVAIVGQGSTHQYIKCNGPDLYRTAAKQSLHNGDKNAIKKFTTKSFLIENDFSYIDDEDQTPQELYMDERSIKINDNNNYQFKKNNSNGTCNIGMQPTIDGNRIVGKAKCPTVTVEENITANNNDTSRLNVEKFNNITNIIDNHQWKQRHNIVGHNNSDINFETNKSHNCQLINNSDGNGNGNGNGLNGNQDDNSGEDVVITNNANKNQQIQRLRYINTNNTNNMNNIKKIIINNCNNNENNNNNDGGNIENVARSESCVVDDHIDNYCKRSNRMTANDSTTSLNCDNADKHPLQRVQCGQTTATATTTTKKTPNEIEPCEKMSSGESINNKNNNNNNNEIENNRHCQEQYNAITKGLDQLNSHQQQIGNNDMPTPNEYDNCSKNDQCCDCCKCRNCSSIKTSDKLATDAISPLLERPSIAIVGCDRPAKRSNKFGLAKTGTPSEHDNGYKFVEKYQSDCSNISCACTTIAATNNSCCKFNGNSDDDDDRTSSASASDCDAIKNKTSVDNTDGVNGGNICNKTKIKSCKNINHNKLTNKIENVACNLNGNVNVNVNAKVNGNDTAKNIISASDKCVNNLDMCDIIDPLVFDDEGDDPYFALQEYLEKVKHEINEVFEQYQAQQNDELPRLPESDRNIGSNKLPLHEMSCILNGTKSDIKLNQISNRNGNSNSQSNHSTISNRKDSNGENVEKRCKKSIKTKMPIATSKVMTIVAAATATAAAAAASATAIMTPGTNTTTTTTISSSSPVVIGITEKGDTSVETLNNIKRSRNYPPTIMTTNMFSSNSKSNDDQIGEKHFNRSQQLQQQHHSHQSQNQNQNQNPKVQYSSSSLNRRLKQRQHEIIQQTSDPDSDSNYITLSSSSTPRILSSSYDQITRAHYSSANSVLHSDSVDDVNIWANKFLKDLDNLMASDKTTTDAKFDQEHVVTASNGTAAAAAIPASMTSINDRTSTLSSILRPEKHTTIPLQSFSLDCRRLENMKNANNTSTIKVLSSANNDSNNFNNNKITISNPRSIQNQSIRYNGIENNHERNSLRTMSSPQSQWQTPAQLQTPESASLKLPSTVLKIEENDCDCTELDLVECNDSDLNDQHKRRTTMITTTTNDSGDGDIEIMQTSLSLSNPSSLSGSGVIGSSNSYSGASCGSVGGVNSKKSTSLMLNSDISKKGSTSTIWTSEESILRSVGAADEDNKSTSSSACEEASGLLSSGKSGISMDSTGLDNDNNESGIGTATPPKDANSWKILQRSSDDDGVMNFDQLHKLKLQKSNSVVSSDDPDLLEVLSLCDELQHDDIDDHNIHNANDNDNNNGNDDDDDDDDGNDVFDIKSFDDFDCIDSGHGVVLRRKSNVQTSTTDDDSQPEIALAFHRFQKCRSHSLETTPQNLHYMKTRDAKEKSKLGLALRQEPFQSILTTNFHELPSPSSASLHSGHESLGMQELTTKSNSAPLLLKKERKRDGDFGGQKQMLRYSRSQSDRYLAEIEAVEACKWLRAAGFPQYAQMYEDHQFPIDLTNVAKDHPNLENDPLQSLYRRLCILNRCANMRLDSAHKPHTPQKDDSDDENFALSENWTFQPHIRRWSRIGEMGLELPSKQMQDKGESSSKESSPDRYEDDSYDPSSGGMSLPIVSSESSQNDSDQAVRLRRTGSERLKDGAKAFLRRVESIKSRRRKRQNRDGIVISGPQVLDLTQLGQRNIRKPEGTYSTPPSPVALSPIHNMFSKTPIYGPELKVPSQSDNFLSPNRLSPKRTPTTPRSMRTSPLHFFANTMPHLKEGKSDDSSSYYSDSQESSSGGKLTIRRQPSRSRRFLQTTRKVDDIGAHSDSECQQGRKFTFKDSNTTPEVKSKKLSRGGSLNLGKDSKKHRDAFHSRSFRSRTSVRKNHKLSESDTESIKIRKSPVVRWHSFQESERPQMIFKKCFSFKSENEKTDGTIFAAMSCGQLQIIRKLALVTLTGHMERYCPTHRSGWNWELPKFIKKIKMPDYKDKRVFGVPLLLILQRTGYTLPIAIKAAFRWLQLNALDQIGLFRKSGVKSRISKLKERIEVTETVAECMEIYDSQQAYDVADMLKQYFRDLPESLLTTKMSETFVAIFQHLPPDVRADAIQCAVLLLPDENREILYALLEFLTLVADNSQYNQMTANNLAVCLAPTLFHSSISTGMSSVTASPRRRKTTGVPDAKELSEAKASHECLAFMIANYRTIFTASPDRISKCNFGYMEESKPVPLEALGEGMQFHNWRGYLYECTSATIKEGREKSRGWFSVSSLDPNVDIGYKKVGDGHPLRLWRCFTEVEGPPNEVLEHIVKQRASWDTNLLQSQVLKKLDERTEIFQYAFDGQIPTDFCVLRSWQFDLPRGACVIVETSIDHPKAKPVYGSIRGVVLASRYLIEPCGSGRSRLMHLARVDIKGKTPEWYNKSYGHICSQYLSRIRAAFRHSADGPESKV